MTRNVYDNSMVAHVWAQQAQESGRSHNGQFYFEGATIYSYGPHFPIATFHQTKKNGRAVLFTTESYSVTTTAHCARARAAIPGGVTVFHVKEPRYPERVKVDYEGRIGRALEQLRDAKRDNKRADYHATACHLVEQANKFARVFGYRWKLKAPAPLSVELIEKLKAQARAKEKREARERARREAEFHRRQQEAYAQWIAGAAVLVSRVDAPCGGPALRIMGDKLQTSYGADVPLTHAVRVFRFVKLCRERGQRWERNGHSLRVGHFTVDSVDAQGNFRAGCHDIKWPEVERVARLAGVYEVGADDSVLEPTRYAA
jgi:hypothetical protein